MSLSPRLRADYLLVGTPTAQRCLEAFATADGAGTYVRYPNIVNRAATVFTELPAMIECCLPPELIAFQVGRFLDSGYSDLNAPDSISINGLLDD